MLRCSKRVEVEKLCIEEHIRAPIAEVFRAMTVPRIVDDWGGGPARIQDRTNGRYSLWDGEMSGVIREIEFPRRLVYTLRELSWDADCPDSLVSWELTETDRGTRLELVHSGLPTRRIREAHREGWGDYYLGPLKAYLEKRKTSK